MTLAAWLAVVACLISAAALIVAVRAQRDADYAARASRGGARQQHRPEQERLWGGYRPDPEEPDPTRPSPAPQVGKPSPSPREGATQEIRMPRPGQM